MSAGGLLGGFVISLWRFFNQAQPNGLGRNPDSADFAVNDRADLLDVGFEFPLGDAGNLSADAAEVLCLASPGDAPAGYRSLARKTTYSRHLKHSCSVRSGAVCAATYAIFEILQKG